MTTKEQQQDTQADRSYCAMSPTGVVAIATGSHVHQPKPEDVWGPTAA